MINCTTDDLYNVIIAHFRRDLFQDCTFVGFLLSLLQLIYISDLLYIMFVFYSVRIIVKIHYLYLAE